MELTLTENQIRGLTLAAEHNGKTFEEYCNSLLAENGDRWYVVDEQNRRNAIVNLILNSNITVEEIDKMVTEKEETAKVSVESVKLEE